MATEHKIITLGMAGLGTVGQGIAQYFREGGPGEKLGIRLKTVAVRDPSKPRDIPFPNLTTNVSDILRDPEVDIFVELMGGMQAKNPILKAMRYGKSVVTANKAVIATHMPKLFEAARSGDGEVGVNLGFEASVGGGIPLIRTFQDYKGERIERVLAIINGTTNYILTQMERGMDFQTALQEAQRLGFAEAKHRLDTGGFDSRYKLAIIASLMFNKYIPPNQIPCEGITGITEVDMDFARRYQTDDGGPGYTIKLLAGAERVNGAIALGVYPALIKKDHPLANIKDEFNAVHLVGEFAGPQTFSGRGAGRSATTSAVIRDIIRIARNIRAEGVADELPTLDAEIEIADPNNVYYSSYIRADLKDRIGSLAETTRILAENRLSIREIRQRESFGYPYHGEQIQPVIHTLHPAHRAQIEQAKAALKKSSRAKGKPFSLRIREEAA